MIRVRIKFRTTIEYPKRLYCVMNMIIFRRFYDFSHLSAEKVYLCQNQDRISRINFEKKQKLRKVRMRRSPPTLI